METSSTVEIKSVLKPPIKLNFLDYINCPICDIEIDIKDKIVDSNSRVTCEDCEHTVNFKMVKI